jgi:hypothetical protein
MRKSQSSVRTRVVRAGIAVGALTAALLVAPQAAYAAITISPSTFVSPGDTISITDTTNGSGTPFTASNGS